MAFCLQLRILLWKNITLKRRSPLVLLFELFIPLVLFVILLAIRNKQPANPVSAASYSANPLPSAGVLAVMQSFCEGGDVDENGFHHYDNSTVFQFLENFQDVAEHNNFFTPKMTLDDIDRLPDVYRSMIDDPASLEDRFNHAHNIQVKQLFTHSDALASILETNFSLPADDVNAIFNSQVNFTKVYELLFGHHVDYPPPIASPQHRQRRDVLRYNPDVLGTVEDGMYRGADRLGWLNPGTQRHMMEAAGINPLQGGLLLEVLKNNPELLRDPVVLKAIASMMGMSTPDTRIDSYTLADVLKRLALSPESLQFMSCHDEDFDDILIPAQPSDQQYIEDAEHILCNMSLTDWQDLSLLLINYTSTEAIQQALDLDDLNYTVATEKFKEFSNNLNQFVIFEKNLVILTHVAAMLPDSACETDQHDITTMDPLAGNSTDGDSDSAKQFDGLVEVWMALQHTICGRDPKISQQQLIKYRETRNLDDLGLSGDQKQELGILVHVLYSNPKVLYAPHNAHSELIIKKANGTFALVDRISEYARRWLNVSAEIREYLQQNTTEANLDKIREMQLELQHIPNLDLMTDDPMLKMFISSNYTVPNTTFLLHQLDQVDRAACSWLTLLKGISLDVFRGFDTEDDAVEYFLDKAYSDSVTVFATVVFKNLNASEPFPPHIVYALRQNASYPLRTTLVRNRYWKPGPRGSVMYHKTGFVWIQDMVERAVIDIHAGRDVLEPGGYFSMMPYPCYMKDDFVFMVEHVMPLCMTISWVYAVAVLVQSIVYEKEKRLKEVMRMMGLSSAVHWLAWFLTSFTQMSVSMAILTAMLHFGKVLMYSNPLIIFLMLEIFAMATISFSFLVSVCYSKAKVAAACAGIVYFLSYVPYMYIAIREDAAGDKISPWTKSLTSLFSTTSFGLGSKYFAMYEIAGVGVQWHNLGVSPIEDDSFTLAMVLVLMLFDAVLYGILTWYIENIHPGSYGLPRPWYFPLSKSYWFGHSKTETEQCSWRQCCHSNQYSLSVMEEDQACALTTEEVSHHFEAEPAHLTQGVCIDNLTKVYKNGKLAVNKLNLNLYEGQITSFLGHNGAGKTTTMSILTGLFPPTSGFASVYGLDIRSDMDEIRKSLGMCPQHNVLFDKLTVDEHIWFYARLKGMSSEDIKEETDRMIEDIGLPKKRHNTVDCLSGGMKRKLSVAIAFVGGSRTVILDEPTAGVDPYARRAIWDLLFKYKNERTILLSTHHMDEADLLGDRIAIISSGQVKCCGSSLFLKSTFGEGYHLTMAKKQPEDDLRSTDTLSLEETMGALRQPLNTSRCSEAVVTNFIRAHVPTAYLKKQTTQELHYILPFGEVKRGNFERLFEMLDKNLQRLKVSSYGLVDTTLEEIFLTVTEMAQNPQANQDKTPSLPKDVISPLHPNSVPKDIPDNMSQRQQQNSFANLLLQNHMYDVELGSMHANRGHRRSRSHGSTYIDLNKAMSRSRDTNSLNSGEVTISGSTDDMMLNGKGMQQQYPMPNFGRPLSRLYANKNALGRAMSGSLDGSSQLFGSPIPVVNGSIDFLDDVPLLGSMNVTSQDDLLFSDNDSWIAGQEKKDLQLSKKVTKDGYTQVPTADVQSSSSNADAEKGAARLEGKGTRTVSGNELMINQFCGIIIKRWYYTRRNWKGLFSQILLPALFVCVAMTVALTAPQVKDMPPIVLSPGQYYTPTMPKGNFVPFSNQAPHITKHSWSDDATARDLVDTLRMPAGIGATCLLKSPHNTSFDRALNEQIKHPDRNYQLERDFFDPACESVFLPGISMDNFIRETAITTTPVWNLTDTTSAADMDTTPPPPRYYPSCQCAADHTGQICSTSGYQKPPEFRVVTSDNLQDVTGQNEREYYLYTNDLYKLHRYGGLSFGLSRDFVPENFGDNAPTEFRKLAVKRAAKVWINNKGFHSLPTYLNVMNNAILRANLPASKGNPSAYGITAINHPMNGTNNQLNLQLILQGSDVLIAIFIICAMSFVPASFVVFLVYERSIKAKHLQYVSGLNRVVYWVANLAWDLCNYLIPMTCCVLILRIFDIPAYVAGLNFPAVIALFVLYGWSITPVMYPASFKFNEPSSAYVFLIVINLFIGITCLICSFLLEIFQRNDKDLEHIHDMLKNIFLIFPNYCLGRGLMDIAFNEYQNQYYFETGQYALMKSPFEWMLVSKNLVAMGITGIVFFIITILCEFNFFCKAKHIPATNMTSAVDGDEDVANERRRVLRGRGKRDLLRLQNLTKIYKTQKLGRHLAVDRLALGVPQGECFGLLGVNGAGKTTTFKMLTGDLAPSAGDAFINGHSIRDDLTAVHQTIGYCPQFDALYDELTAREHLHLYARLRGVCAEERPQVVEWALEKLCLTEYADRLSGTYSGGNKRKLSTAIALIGQPLAIFLDEPTTGMDPHSRRFLWDLILDLIQDGRCIVLTSHSMEECEALCSRLAIMVNGRFHCLGSVQHLKTRFGEGYTVSLRLQGTAHSGQQRAIQRFFDRHFPQAKLKESHHSIVQYELPIAGLSLAKLFCELEKAQAILQVEDYSVTQNTLDNVFINFVKQQQEIVQERVDLMGDLHEPAGRQAEDRHCSQLRAPNTELQSLVREQEEYGDDEPLLDIATGSSPLYGDETLVGVHEACRGGDQHDYLNPLLHKPNDLTFHNPDGENNPQLFDTSRIRNLQII